MGQNICVITSIFHCKKVPNIIYITIPVWYEFSIHYSILFFVIKSSTEISISQEFGSNNKIWCGHFCVPKTFTIILGTKITYLKVLDSQSLKSSQFCSSILLSVINEMIFSWIYLQPVRFKIQFQETCDTFLFCSRK